MKYRKRKNKFENELNTERLFYNATGKLESKIIYKYDNEGNCSEFISYNEKGEIENKTTLKYNNNNEEIEKYINSVFK